MANEVWVIMSESEWSLSPQVELNIYKLSLRQSKLQ